MPLFSLVYTSIQIGTENITAASGNLPDFTQTIRERCMKSSSLHSKPLPGSQAVSSSHLFLRGQHNLFSFRDLLFSNDITEGYMHSSQYMEPAQESYIQTTRYPTLGGEKEKENA